MSYWNRQGGGGAPGHQPYPTQSPFGQGQGQNYGGYEHRERRRSGSAYGRVVGRQAPGGAGQLTSIFQGVDRNRSGTIDAAELQAALSNGTWTPFNDQTVRLLMNMFDRNKNGTIGLEEFGALWKYVSEWQEIFVRFDSDRSGVIDRRQLHQALITFGYTLTEDSLRDLMTRFDRSRTGRLIFDDFIQLCVVLQMLTAEFRRKDTRRKGVVRITYEDFLGMVLNSKI